jgi:hypothetical protein
MELYTRPFAILSVFCHELTVLRRALPDYNQGRSVHVNRVSPANTSKK